MPPASTVAPGFIDMHNHSDYTILAEPKSESMIRQGVTTMVLGESRSAGPVKTGANDDPRSRSDGANVDWTTLGGYFQRARAPAHGDQHRVVCGRGTGLDVRQRLRAVRRRPPAEIDEMKKLVAQAMEEGAMGLSTALLGAAVQPGDDGQSRSSSRRWPGNTAGSMRPTSADEGERVFQRRRRGHSGREGREHTGGHHPHEDRAQKLWGRVNEIIAMVQKARDEGRTVTANVYPYTAGQNNLSSIIPPWAHDGGREQMVERLRDPAARRRMHGEILNGLPNWYNHYLATGDGWAGHDPRCPCSSERNKPFQGKRMSELIAARGGDPVDVLFDLLDRRATAAFQRCSSTIPSRTCSWC